MLGTIIIKDYFSFWLKKKNVLWKKVYNLYIVKMLQLTLSFFCEYVCNYLSIKYKNVGCI